MATHSVTTHSLAHKADSGYFPTPIATAFSGLIRVLPEHIAAEQEIEDVDIWDPAFRSWLTDAEAAYEAVTTQLSTIMTLEELRPEDRPLKRMAILLDAMIGSEDPDTFHNFHVLLPRFDALFWCAGNSDPADHANQMLALARDHIDAMARLSAYDGAPDIGTDEADPAQRPL